MARVRPKSVLVPPTDWTPTQPVDEPILCSPFEEPSAHWSYKSGHATRAPGRRPAGYFFTSVRVGTGQQSLFDSDQQDQLELVNWLREDVGRWRKAGYRGASRVTRDLFAHWFEGSRPRKLFFCQREAGETLIYLLEMALPGKLAATEYKKFRVDGSVLRDLLSREQALAPSDTFVQRPRLIDVPADPALLPLLRLGCKMATGSGKTVVMAMLIAWAFCNRGRNPATESFPNGVLVCGPNLTVRKRLQVLQPAHEDNYYAKFDLVPPRYRDLLRSGKVLTTNWHAFQPKSEHVEGGTSYRVVEKGDESADAFARDRLGELAARLPILVLNDEGHHCWRPKPDGKDDAKGLSAEEKAALKEEAEEARVWLAGLDRINNSGLVGKDQPCVSAAVDMSATPFYLAGSGHPEGSPFPWLVSDFGLVDAIESGIVKIPRMPIRDDANAKDERGLPDPKYFRLWRHIQEGLHSADKVKDRPKPEALYREAEGALLTLAGQWHTRLTQIQAGSSGQPTIPPVLVVICDNTELAEFVYGKVSGERVREVVDEDGKVSTTTVYQGSAVFPELANDERNRRTVRIDSKLLAALETEDGQSKDQAAQALRALIDTVGKPGQPGEHVRCVVSVSMLTEGWDASNVTHILGIRAFGSQLLCEQVVGRGLRRMSYEVNRETKRLEPEYVDVYGIPFSLIPYKGQPSTVTPPDTPVKRIFPVPEKAAYRVEMPIVESYTYDVRRSGIRCNVDALEGFVVDDEPTRVYIAPTRGISEHPAATALPSETVEQTRAEFYEATRYQQVLFGLAQRISDALVQGGEGPRAEALRKSLVARHQVFPDILRIVRDYVERRVTFAKGVDPRELALVKYANLLRERVLAGILPDAASPQAPLLPVVNSFQERASTADVDETTRRPTYPVEKCHLNQAIVLSSWERRAIDILDDMDAVEAYAPNFRRLGFQIPWEYQGAARRYEPDFVVRMRGGVQVLLEIKGGLGKIHGEDEVHAKNQATKKWVAAVNNARRFGRWAWEFCEKLPELRGLLEPHAEGGAIVLPFRRVEKPKPDDFYRTCVPLTSLRAAAGGWSDEQLALELAPDESEEWVTWDRRGGFAKGMFVARVVGHSMEPDIPNGAYCLFRPATAAGREGKPVLVWATGIADRETSGKYTVKILTTEETTAPDGGWRHRRVVLRPINPEYDPIVLDSVDEDDVRVIAEVVEVLGDQSQEVN